MKNKTELMDKHADLVRKHQNSPSLRYLFLELTKNCNEHCLHCGSRCGQQVTKGELTLSDYEKLIAHIRENFSPKETMLCITGGEPLLRKDFFAITRRIKEAGFPWGMTSNGTLIRTETASMLKESGMRTISISIDGLEESHDAFRQTKGGYQKAMAGINALIAEGGFEHIQVTTVIHRKNIHELDALYDIFSEMEIDSWRVINLEPIGRTLDHEDLLLTPSDYRTLFDFIKEKRLMGMPLSYGCSHYLGPSYERTVRGWFYECLAGKGVASITSTGDITACLDIAPGPELIFGNIKTDDFASVWKNRFEIFRSDRKSEFCDSCPDFKYCRGDSFHTWDFKQQKPMLCMKEILKF